MGPELSPLTVHTVSTFLGLWKAIVKLIPFCVLNYLVIPCSSVAQVRLRCQKGIPPSLRGRAWLFLSGGKVKKEQNQGKFQVREISISLPPCSFFYVVFWDHFIFKSHLKLLTETVAMPAVLVLWLRTLMCSTQGWSQFPFGSVSSKM